MNHEELKKLDDASMPLLWQLSEFLNVTAARTHNPISQEWSEGVGKGVGVF